MDFEFIETVLELPEFRVISQVVSESPSRASTRSIPSPLFKFLTTKLSRLIPDALQISLTGLVLFLYICLFTFLRG